MSKPKNISDEQKDMDRFKALSMLINSAGLASESYENQTPLAKRAFNKIQSAVCNLFSEIQIAPNDFKKMPDGPSWIESILSLIEQIDDDCESFDYEVFDLVKKFKYKMAGTACYGFEGDMFVDSRGRCFTLDAVCHFNAEYDDWSGWKGGDDPEFITRNGKDYSSVQHSGFNSEAKMRRVDPKSFHYCRWDAKSLLEYKHDKSKKTGEQPYRGMYFQMAGAAESLKQLSINPK